MNIESFREYCISKKGVAEEFPFDNVTLVFKVMGKMFALTDIDFFKSVNLKCDPQRAIELRDQFAAIKSGYHMNKKHWNTVEMDGSLTDLFVKDLVDHSYDCVVANLPKKLKTELEENN